MDIDFKDLKPIINNNSKHTCQRNISNSQNIHFCLCNRMSNSKRVPIYLDVMSKVHKEIINKFNLLDISHEELAIYLEAHTVIHSVLSYQEKCNFSHF